MLDNQVEKARTLALAHLMRSLDGVTALLKGVSGCGFGNEELTLRASFAGFDELDQILS